MASDRPTFEGSPNGGERARLIATVLAMPDPVVVTDPNLQVEFINTTFEEVLGLKPQHALGRPLPEVISNPEILQALQLVRDDPEADAQIWHIAVPSPTGGRVRSFELKITRVTVDDRLVGLVAMLDEVTRYHELMDLKTDFVNTVSHQFRTPLTSVMLNASTLIDGYGAPGGAVTPEQRELLGSMIQETERLARMVNDLLDLSRLESGRAQLKLGRVDLKGLVDSVMRPLAPLAAQKGIFLDSLLKDGLPPVLADGSRLGWVLTNLVSNAIKHTSSGGVSVSAEVMGWRMRVSVADSGSGIPEEYRSRLFERFFQVPGSEASQQGSGLGLAIAKEVVEAHGGRIWFDSEVNRGTTFTFTLPLSSNLGGGDVETKKAGQSVDGGEDAFLGGGDQDVHKQ